MENWHLPVLLSPGRISTASVAEVFRSVNSFTCSLGIFQIAVFLLGLGASEAKCKPFKRGMSVSYSISVPWILAPLIF